MYNILKLKSIFETVTKEMPKVLKIMILGFILIIAILIIKYKPVYEVKENGETLGYIQNKNVFDGLINGQIINDWLRGLKRNTGSGIIKSTKSGNQEWLWRF